MVRLRPQTGQRPVPQFNAQLGQALENNELFEDVGQIGTPLQRHPVPNGSLGLFLGREHVPVYPRLQQRRRRNPVHPHHVFSRPPMPHRNRPLPAAFQKIPQRNLVRVRPPINGKNKGFSGRHGALESVEKMGDVVL